MSRPAVIVATTDPAMVSALSELRHICLALGLDLHINPGAERSGSQPDTPVVYDCAEALMDELDRRACADPIALSDTLVILDVGSQFDEALDCAVSGGDRGWHRTHARRPGIAVELILRFPQVFPVILSSVVPTVRDRPPKPGSAMGAAFDAAGQEIRQEGGEDRSDLNQWQSWQRFIDRCVMCDMPDERFGESLVWTVSLNFVSPLSGVKSLEYVLKRFAGGMRCWFDPTGLRTFVKSRFLGTMFGSSDKWDNTADQRKVLRSRIEQAAVAIDEEREFAVLSAYGAYKFGRRSWLVTSFAEFGNYPLKPDDDPPLWSADYIKSDDVVILRDIDLRFPDLPDKSPRLRDELADIDKWKDRLGERWMVRAISSHRGMLNISDCRKTPPRLGQLGLNTYVGLSKPIGSLYELKLLLRNSHSVAARLKPAATSGSGGHGAPYLNLAIAESLISQARKYQGEPVANLIGALLAGEASELLLGMSQTTALEALLLQHKKEVAAEVEFPGISHNIKIHERRADIEAAVAAALTAESIAPTSNQRKIREVFLSQFWAEIRIEYRRGEQFEAAESANIRSLIHSNWLQFSGNMLYTRSGFLHPKSQIRSNFVPVNMLKSIVVYTMCRLSWWSWAFLVLNFFSYLLYYCYADVGAEPPLLSIILSSVTLQPTAQLGDLINGCSSSFLLMVALFHLGGSYLLFGALISMLYRKVTRG